MEIIGLLGALFFAVAAVPAAWQTLKARHHLGTPLSISIPILLGLILMYVYLFATMGFNWVVALSYGLEGSSWYILFHYALRDWMKKHL